MAESGASSPATAIPASIAAQTAGTEYDPNSQGFGVPDKAIPNSDLTKSGMAESLITKALGLKAEGGPRDKVIKVGAEELANAPPSQVPAILKANFGLELPRGDSDLLFNMSRLNAIDANLGYGLSKIYKNAVGNDQIEQAHLVENSNTLDEPAQQKLIQDSFGKLFGQKVASVKGDGFGNWIGMTSGGTSFALKADQIGGMLRNRARNIYGLDTTAAQKPKFDTTEFDSLTSASELEIRPDGSAALDGDGNPIYKTTSSLTSTQRIAAKNYAQKLFDAGMSNEEATALGILAGTSRIEKSDLGNGRFGLSVVHTRGIPVDDRVSGITDNMNFTEAQVNRLMTIIGTDWDASGGNVKPPVTAAVADATPTNTQPNITGITPDQPITPDDTPEVVQEKSSQQSRGLMEELMVGVESNTENDMNALSNLRAMQNGKSNNFPESLKPHVNSLDLFKLDMATAPVSSLIAAQKQLVNVYNANRKPNEPLFKDLEGFSTAVGKFQTTYENIEKAAADGYIDDSKPYTGDQQWGVVKYMDDMGGNPIRDAFVGPRKNVSAAAHFISRHWEGYNKKTNPDNWKILKKRLDAMYTKMQQPSIAATGIPDTRDLAAR